MRRLILIVALFAEVRAHGQIATGLFQDNYTASTSMLINPASPFTDPDSWEVNIVSAGLFLDNNYYYYNHQTVFSLINYLQSNYHNAQNNSFFTPTTVQLNGEGFLQGPSAYFHINNFIIGFFTDDRVAGSIESASSPQNVTSLFTVPYDLQVGIPELHAAFINWAEVGVTGGALLTGSSTNKLYAGINIKLTGGVTGGELSSQPFTIDRHSKDSIVTTTPVNLTYAYAQSTGNGISNLFGFNGKGVGADFGVLYVIGEKISCKELYNWKIGISINDVGYITYKAQSQDYSVISPGTAFPDTAFVHSTTLLDVNQTLSQIAYDNQFLSKIGSSFTVGLPTSANLAIDKCLGDGFYIDLSVLQRVPIMQNTIYAPDIESLTPRYESRWFTLAVPLSLYDEYDFHFGLSVRVGVLTIGSDDLESLFIPGKLAGTDVYVGLRISNFQWDCRPQKQAIESPSDKYKECPLPVPTQQY